MTRYTIRQAFEGSHHIYTDDDNLVAKIEKIEVSPKKTPLLLSWLPKKIRDAYVITHLPGTEQHQFLTLHSAATHAVNFHSKGGHLNIEHPVDSIHSHMKNLKDAIWHAASDPRMESDEDQVKLLDLSKDQAMLHQKLNTHYPKEK